MLSVLIPFHFFVSLSLWNTFLSELGSWRPVFFADSTNKKQKTPQDKPKIRTPSNAFHYSVNFKKKTQDYACKARQTQAKGGKKRKNRPKRDGWWKRGVHQVQWIECLFSLLHSSALFFLHQLQNKHNQTHARPPNKTHTHKHTVVLRLLFLCECEWMMVSWFADQWLQTKKKQNTHKKA